MLGIAGCLLAVLQASRLSPNAGNRQVETVNGKDTFPIPAHLLLGTESYNESLGTFYKELADIDTTRTKSVRDMHLELLAGLARQRRSGNSKL